MPQSTVIPELPYPDVNRAVEWLCRTFGFTMRLRIGDHRAQLNVADGAIVVTQANAAGTQRVMVRVADVSAHHARALQCGAHVLGPPTDYPYGERQYSVEDLGGHRWTFSESITDVDPRDWGGQVSGSASPVDR